MVFSFSKNADLLEKFKQEADASNQLKMQYSNLNRVCVNFRHLPIK